MKTARQYAKPRPNLNTPSDLVDEYPEFQSVLYPRFLKSIIKRFRSDFKTRFATFGFLTDAFLLNLCFFAVYFFRKSNLIISLPYLKLFLVMNLVWLPVSLLTQKFTLARYRDFNSSFFTVFKSTLYMTYVLSFIIIILNLLAFSRAHVFGTCLLYGTFQIIFVGMYFITHRNSIHLPGIRAEVYSHDLQYSFSFRKLFADFMLVTGAFYTLNYFKRSTFMLNTEYEKALLLIYGVWFVTSIYTGKFYQRRHSNLVHAITPFIKSLVLNVAVTSLIVFFFRLSFYSRLHIFGTFFVLGFAEIVLYFLYSDLPIKDHSEIKDIESIDETKAIFKQENLLDEKENFTPAKDVLYPVKKELERRYLKAWPEVLSFLKEYIDFSQIDAADTVVLKQENLKKLEPLRIKSFDIDGTVSPRDTVQRIRVIENKSVRLLVNLHKVNDIRRINRYFLEVHKKLYNNGYFIARVETIRTHKQKILSKFPPYIGFTVYYMNFIVSRIFPKIPLLKNLYFSCTRGKNRVLSQAEVLGRLYFCGFKVIASREINNCLYLVARKIKNASIDKNPSYGPVIKLRRIGYGGKIIYINKLRTMHPYSEYLQEYIYENFKLNANGKFKNDFRVTNWGRLFRKFWVDEFPQIANFFRGDLAFIGVRALSSHYFNLYPKDLQSLRIQFYPGLVPPYYADMPKSFEEIVASERKYLKLKQKHPFTTDVKYLFKACYNIIFKRARSN